ncbi:MAG: sensor histidine kinase [Gammaproteobacteria bacterium]|nr:sensor histidine kinase [Gammaproteobacteria bacterium]
MNDRPEAVRNPEPSPTFLPDFCDTRVIMRVIFMSELLALILSLAAWVSGRGFWTSLFMTSMFVQWVALGNVLLLCLTRTWLRNRSTRTVMSTSYLIILLVTVLVSLGALSLTPGSTRLPADSLIFVLGNVGISAIVSAVALRYFYVQHQWKSNIQADARSRIQALQARIRPHFLFNSMNTIAALTRTDPVLAETAVEDLADLFRASLGQRERVPLSEELKFTRGYINIEQLRLGDRLKVDWEIDETVPESLEVPALVLQPLMENAIYHGIEPQTTGGTVSISISRNGDMVEFRITNPLPTTLSSYKRTGNKMAQENIRQRLRLAYGEPSVPRLEKTETQYSVSFAIPLESET